MRAAIRGGNFNNAANAGVFALNLNNAPSNSNYNIGFRAAKLKIPSQTFWTSIPDAAQSALEP